MMERLRLILLVLLTALSVNIVHAEDIWQQFNSSNDINTMAWDRVDSDILWIGTNGGLIRYNVVTGGITLFNTVNSGLPSNRINTIAVADNNDIWVGTADRGLARYDGNVFTQFNTENSDLLLNSIRKIEFDETGVLWIAYTRLYVGSFYIPGRELKEEELSRGPYKVFDLNVNSSNDIWASAFWYSIYHFNGYNWTSYSAQYSAVYGIKKGPDGYVWLAQGLRASKFLDVNSTWVTYTGLPASGLVSVYIDESNVKWFGSENGLLRYNDISWELFDMDNSQLPSNNILSMLEDRHNTGMWIGTSLGLVFFDGTEFEFHDVNVSGLLSNVIRDGIADHNGVVWLATDRGLCRYDGYEFTAYTSLNSPLTSDIITALEVDNNNRLWIGTLDGLFSYDEGIWQHYTADNSFWSSDFIRRLVLDLNNNLYIYTNEHLPHYDYSEDPLYGRSSTVSNGSLFLIDIENMELISNVSGHFFSITTLQVDNANNLWFNSRDCIGLGETIWFFDDLYMFDGQNVHHQFALYDSGMESLLVYDMHPEGEGMWIATGRYTHDSGDITYYSLFLFEDGEVSEHYTIYNSLLPHYSVISLLLEDDVFWIGTPAGVCKVVGDEWEVFTIEDSLLPSNIVRRIFSKNGVRTWIVTDNGIAVYGRELSIEKEETEVVPSLKTYPPFPNPFSPTGREGRSAEINIRYSIPSDTEVRIDIYNVLGQHIDSLENDYVREGEHHITWDGRDKNRRAVPSGVYLYRIRTEKESVTGKVLIVR